MLSIPELLDIIFSFILSKKELFSSLLVCRLWFIRASPFYWENTKFINDSANTNRLMEKLLSNSHYGCRYIKHLSFEKISNPPFVMSTLIRQSSKIQSLSLYDCFMNFLDLEGLSHLQSLQYSSKSKNSMTNILHNPVTIYRSDDLRILNGPNTLNTLVLDYCNVSSKILIDLVKDNRNLCHLSLKGHDITDDTLLALSKFCQKLFHIDLSYNPHISDGGIISISESCSLIESYVLVLCPLFTKKGIISIISQSKNLRNLDISDNSFVTDELINTIFIKCLPSSLENIKININGCHSLSKSVLESIAFTHGNLFVGIPKEYLLYKRLTMEFEDENIDFSGIYKDFLSNFYLSE